MSNSKTIDMRDTVSAVNLWTCLVNASRSIRHKRRRELLKIQFDRCKIRLRALVSWLPPRELSAWFHLFRHHRDSGDYFLSCLGIPYRAFKRLLLKFDRLYTPLYGPIEGKRGRPRVTHSHQALSVLLMYYASSGSVKHIGLIHNMTPRRVAEIIQRSECLLQRVLRQFPDAAVCWPSLAEQQEAALRIHEAHPAVPGRFGFVDGKNLFVQEPSDVDKQNSMYNGWLHCVFVTGILVFDSRGVLIYCKHNCPGELPFCNSCIRYQPSHACIRFVERWRHVWGSVSQIDESGKDSARIRSCRRYRISRW
jgi:hypothetical protein